MLFQMMALRACIGARSTSEKSIFLLSSAPYDLSVFFAFTSIMGGITVNGVDVRHRAKGCIEWHSRRVVLAHGRHAQQQFDRTHEGAGGVERAVDDAAFDVRAEDEADGAARIDVIRAILGIIFNNKDRGIRPILAVAHGIDELSDGVVVVRDHGLRSECARLGPPSVIFGHAHDHKIGKALLGVRAVIVLLVLLELAQKDGDIAGVALARSAVVPGRRGQPDR